MKSVFHRALGDAADELHPAIRERYALTSADERRCVGRGRMRSIRRQPLALPVLWAGIREHLLFPETGLDVPFEVRTTPFVDDGVETVAYVREFDVGPGRRFDAYMHYDDARDCIVDELGRHRRLATELEFSVTAEGALRIESGKQWVRGRDREVRIPRVLGADVTVIERYDDSTGRFRIEVAIRNPLVGQVFAYDGWFTVSYEDCATLPDSDAPAGWERDR